MSAPVCVESTAKADNAMQAVKATRAMQEETSEDFSSADEWQTAKAKMRR